MAKREPLTDEDKAQRERAVTDRLRAQVVDEDTGQVSDLQIETLAGDVRDAMLMRVREMKRPWSMMTEDEQRDIANGLEQAARHLTRAAVRVLTNWEWPRVVVTLGEIKIIGGDKARIEGKIVAPNVDEYRNVLGEHAGQQVMILAVDSETFMGEREPVEINPDQPEFPDGEDQDEAA
jgi:hypothetical protein